MLLLRRGVLGGAGKRRTAARFNSWSNTVPKGCCGPLCPALGLLERLFASDNVTLALQLGKTLKSDADAMPRLPAFLCTLCTALAAALAPSVLVVGGTGRIGTAVAIHLLQRRPELRVVLAGRSAERGRAAVDEVAREASACEFVELNYKDAAAMRNATLMYDYTRPVTMNHIVTEQGALPYLDVQGMSHFVNQNGKKDS